MKIRQSFTRKLFVFCFLAVQVLSVQVFSQQAFSIPISGENDSYFFKSKSDGHKIHGLLFQASNPKAGLLVVHGLQSHSGWFRESGEFLSDQGITVLAIDRTGSGQSEGEIKSTTGFYQDLIDGANELRSKLPTGTPIHVHANCFGSRSVVPFMMNSNYKKPFQTAIITAPASEMYSVAEYPKNYSMLNCLNGAAIGNWSVCDSMGWSVVDTKTNMKRIKTPLKDELFTSSRVWLNWMKQDRYANRNFSPRFLLAAKDLNVEFEKYTKPQSGYLGGFSDEDEMSLPDLNFRALVIWGAKDKMVDVKKVKANFVQQLGGYGEYVELSKCEHALEFCEDPADLRRYREAMLTWLLKHSHRTL